MAIGSSTTNKSTSFHGVGDFYPSSLLSNKRGANNVTLPTLNEAVKSFLSNNQVYPDDVIVIESGINDILGFFEANIITTLTYAEDASSGNTTIPMFVVQDVAGAIRDALEDLYKAGARRFAVWDLCAGELVPLAHTLNNLMNTVNAILQGIRALDARQNALRDFTKTFVDTANLALEDVVKSFSTAHQDAGVVSIPFATIQRGFVSNYGQLGFVNAESGCASDLAISQYSTGNLFSLANPTFTAEGAKATLTLSPFLTQKLNKLGSDLYGANGQQNTPRTTADFIERLKSIFASYLDDSNTLGHLTGYILTSQPLTKGGLSPYDIVPTCFLQSADHLFHDEVHPTTKQHQLLAQAFLTYAKKLFQ
ncbi:g12865 [Coccomyxa viridis]|uniref:G12865 protein n=1 Tax=Coccomyxa viridis TaxID=1274662 RepID=A0ABP1GE11_9CHLO